MKWFSTGLVLWVLTMSQAHALIIGSTANYPPFASLADQENHFVGFDIEIMTAICKRIQQPCRFTPIIMANVKTELVAGSIDLAISAIIIPDAPSPYFLYSLPYLESYAQFIVNQNSPIKTFDDIRHKKIGTRTEGIYTDFLHKHFDNDNTISTYLTLNLIMAALSEHKIDVVLNNAPAIRYWLASGGGNYRKVGEKLIIGNGYGIMAYQGQEALIGKINQAIQDMMDDGSYAAIYSRYFAQ